MATSSPPSAEPPGPTIARDAGGATAGPHTADDDSGRVGTLRGASVQFDAHRLVAVVLGLIMATLAALVATFTVAGIHSNQQIDELHTRGVPVTVTVKGCLGLLGGSGSNAAGYSCHGTYTLDGRNYSEALPGITFYPPGTKVAAVAVPGDPTLLSKASVVNTQHSSASVFVLPLVLAIVLLALVTLVIIRRRRGRRQGAQPAGVQPIAAT